MTISLKPLFEEIYQAKDEAGLRFLRSCAGALITPCAKNWEVLYCQAIRDFLFDQLLADQELQTVLNLALSLEHNPVARYTSDLAQTAVSIRQLKNSDCTSKVLTMDFHHIRLFAAPSKSDKTS